MKHFLVKIKIVPGSLEVFFKPLYDLLFVHLRGYGYCPLRPPPIFKVLFVVIKIH